MSKLKIEHGVSKTERVKLQVSIDQTVSDDIELMAKWSDNEKNYIVNELLRFALGESGEFQQHKQTHRNAPQPMQSGSAITQPQGAPVASIPTARPSEAAR